MNLRRLPLGLVVLLGVLAAHAGSLGGRFHYDDENVILLNREHLEDWSTVGRMFTDPTVFGGVPGNPMFRPVAHATHVWDAHMGDWGPDGPSPLPFHLTNLLLHAAAALVLYHLLRRVLRVLAPGEPFGPDRPPAADVAALLGALWFGLQPVNSEVVNYVSARSESLAGLFFLLALWAHHAAWEEGVGRGKRIVLIATSLVAAAVSFGSKETGILLPAVAGALELWARPEIEAAHKSLWRAIKRTIPLAIIVGIYLSVRVLVMPGTHIETRNGVLAAVLVTLLIVVRVLIRIPAIARIAGGGFEFLKSIRPSFWSVATFLTVLVGSLGLGPVSSGNTGIDPLVGGGRTMAAHLLTQARVAGNYALLLLFPVDLAPDHGVRVSAGIDGPTALAILGIAAAAAFVVRSALRGSRAVPLVAAWAALAIAPSVLVPLNVVMNEHRLYLPTTGLALGAGLLMLALLRAGVRTGRGLLAGLSLLAIFGSFIAVDNARAMDWRDPMLLWSRAVATSPASWRNHMHRGVELYRESQEDYAERDALAGTDDRRSRFKDLRARDELDGALEEFQESQRLYPRAFETRLNLGFAHLYRGLILNEDCDPDGPPSRPEEFREAIRWFALAEESSPGSFRALYNRATAMAKAGMVPEAIAEFERLAQDKSRTTMYAWPLVDLYRRAGRIDDALAQLDLIERLTPEQAGVAALKRAEALTAARRFTDAEKELRRAGTLLGLTDPGPPLYMARMLVATGVPENLPAARALWDAALKRGHRPGPRDRAVVEALAR